MSEALISGKCIVKKSHIHGYGVFAAQAILPDEIIEEAYALKLNKDVHIPDLNDYLFGTGDYVELVLGNGSIYNHADQPNAVQVFDEERFIMTYRALTKISRGEEILISYGKNWFSQRYTKVMVPSLRYRLRTYKPLFKILTRFALVVVGLWTTVWLVHH
jgi:hypothetical protein